MGEVSCLGSQLTSVYKQFLQTNCCSEHCVFCSICCCHQQEVPPIPNTHVAIAAGSLLVFPVVYGSEIHHGVKEVAVLKA